MAYRSLTYMMSCGYFRWCAGGGFQPSFVCLEGLQHDKCPGRQAEVSGLSRRCSEGLLKLS
eukprot:1740339-Amphidinium_carterae.1